VLIPVVTIPAVADRCLQPDADGGFQFQLLTLLAMVLAIGLVVDDAIVVVENIHRHLEEATSRAGRDAGRTRDRRPRRLHDHHGLPAVYAPIGFLGGLDRLSVQGFAFTLRAP